MSSVIREPRLRCARRSPLECMESWRPVLDSVPDTLLLLDERGMVQYLNHAPPGFAREHVVAHAATDWAPPESRDELRQALADVFRSAASRSGVQRVVRPDGIERWYAVHANPLVAGGVVVAAVVVARDVTRARRLRGTAHAARRALERDRQLEALRRECRDLESLASHAAGIAHDFRNLLTVVGCSARDLECAVGDAQECAEDLRAILDATDRGAELASQLMERARHRTPPGRLVDLNAVVRDVAALARRVTEERIAIVQRLDPAGAPVWGDASQLARVVMNLVLNARDAIAGRGTITVETTRILSRTVLRVEDDGSGMSDDVRQRIFDPFFTTRRDSGGTGMGLAAVREIVHEAGGTIDVESAPGLGTAFEIQLPRARPAA